MSHIRYGKYRVPLPRSRWVRVGLGSVLVLGGLPPHGPFIPMLGWGSIAVGMLVLSYDIPMIRRWRRRSEVKGLRWWRKHKHNGAIGRVRAISVAIAGWPFAVLYWTKRRLRHLRSKLLWYRWTRADIRRTRIQRRHHRRATTQNRS